MSLTQSLDKFCLSIEGLDYSLLAKRFFNQLSLNSPRLCLLLEEMIGSLGNKA
ncbi:Uncharacterised protein [Mycobacterium tuberculosis]|nr:Uncharacterised protein [Mycobacterium tuberculosis]CKW81040.1 Uncharacterised protein [Mycobacterium tuberculosis]